MTMDNRPSLGGQAPVDGDRHDRRHEAVAVSVRARAQLDGHAISSLRQRLFLCPRISTFWL